MSAEPARVLERVNQRVSVQDLDATPAQPPGPPTLRPLLPTPPASIPRAPGAVQPQVLPAQPDYSQGLLITPQVMNTELPMPSDGLEGNRQVALTPFPNLYMQSGPLAKHQLPWYHQLPQDSPYSLARASEYQFMGGMLRSNGISDRAYGWYNVLSAGFPFWTERTVGVQVAAMFEPTTYPQIYTGFTTAFFHRAIWPLDAEIYPGFFDRISYGFGYDGFYDSESRVYLGQTRAQLAYALSPSREWGVWGAIPLQDAISTTAADFPEQISPSSQAMLYYRQTFANEMDLTVFTGWIESPGIIQSGAYFDYRLTRQVAFVFQGMFGYERDGSRIVYIGLRMYFQPLESYALISGNPQNRYRPFLRPLDHINFILRRVAAN